MEATTTILTSTLLAAFVSAGVSALVSIFVKDKEYRNDYYKKVIDKRIKAIEGVENMIGQFSTTTRVSSEDRFIFDFFVKFPKPEEDDVFLKLIQVFSQQSVWLSPQSIQCTQAFVYKVVSLRSDASKINDAVSLANHYLDAHQEVVALRSEVEKSITADMTTLYNVKAFFKARRNASLE